MLTKLNIFEPKITIKGFHIETNIKDIPSKIEIKDKICNYFNENPKERHFFQENFNLVSKDPLNFLNPDTIFHMKSFIFEINESSYNKIYNSIYDKFLIELNEINAMAYADLSMYNPDQYEYQISYLLIENIQNLVQIISQKKT